RGCWTTGAVLSRPAIEGFLGAASGSGGAAAATGAAGIAGALGSGCAAAAPSNIATAMPARNHDQRFTPRPQRSTSTSPRRRSPQEQRTGALNGVQIPAEAQRDVPPPARSNARAKLAASTTCEPCRTPYLSDSRV